MIEKQANWQPLFIPAIALCYSAHSIWEHLNSGYARLTIEYGLMINFCLVGFAVASMARTLFTLGARAGRTDSAGGRRNLLRAIAVLLTAWVAVLFLPFLGYVITFGALMFVCLVIMGVHSPLILIATTVGMVAFIHFGFVEVMRLALPVGLLG